MYRSRENKSGGQGITAPNSVFPAAGNDLIVKISTALRPQGPTDLRIWVSVLFHFQIAPFTDLVIA
jgi:hypothetical protein